MSSACNCCEQPPCDTPEIQFISARGEPCGLVPGTDTTFLCFGNETNATIGVPEAEFMGVYQNVIITKTVDFSYTDENGSVTTYGGTWVTTYSKSLDEGDCVGGPTLGSGSWSGSFTQGYGEEGPPEGDHYLGYTFSGSGSGVLTPGNMSPGTTTTTTSYSESEGSTSTAGAFTASLTGFVSAEWVESTYIITAEDGSISIAFSGIADALFVDYPAWLGESEDPYTTGQGNANTAENTPTYQVKIKWRLRHKPTGTCYLKAWVRKTFTPAPTDPPTDPLPAPTITDVTYEWAGTGDPCLTDPLKAYNHDDNRITATENEELPPAELGETLVELLKFSCVEGYEPDISDPENPQPNGFPDPEWEASPP